MPDIGKVVLLGIDGLDSTLLGELMERGRLKNFSDIAQGGVLGYNRVFIPPLSPAIWASLATGLSPLQHGVFDFVETINVNGRVKNVIHLSNVLKGRSIWDYLTIQGYKAIVVNYPLTYPPYPVNGIMISGFPSPKQDIVAYPSVIKNKLKRLVPQYKTEYIPSVPSGNVESRDGLRRLTDEAIRNMENRVRLWKHLVKKHDWSFASLVLTEIDRVQHVIFGYHHCREHVVRLYENLDRLIGEVVKVTDMFDADILIVSDHGFERLNKYISLPKMLEEMNVQYSNNAVFTMMRSKSVQRTIFGLTKIGVIQSLITHLTATNLFNLMSKMLNPSTSISSVIIQNNFSLTLPNPNKKDLASLQKTLLETKDPETSKFILDRVFTREEYIDYILSSHASRTASVSKDADDFLSYLPDLILVPRAGYEPTMKYLPTVTSVQKDGEMTKTGTHYSSQTSKGVFLAYGPRIKRKKNGLCVKVDVLDIAPTILALFGIHPPTSMYGKILSDIFKIEKSLKLVHSRLLRTKMLSLRRRLAA
jgi:predicted AlkP superfamily phosphohydrolase/phosphomutase